MQTYLYEQKSAKGQHYKRLNFLSRRLKEIQVGSSLTGKIFKTKPPPPLINAKKIAQDYQTQKKVQHQNNLLLNKLNESPTMFKSYNAPFRRRSLNKQRRRRQNSRINTQNNQFVNRIIHQKSHYQYNKFHRSYLQNLQISRLRRKTYSNTQFQDIRSSSRPFDKTVIQRQHIDNHFETYKNKVYYLQLSKINKKDGMILIQQLSTKKQYGITIKEQIIQQLSQAFKTINFLGVLVFKVFQGFQMRLTFQDGKTKVLWFSQLKKSIINSAIKVGDVNQNEDDEIRSIYQKQLYIKNVQ